MNTRPLIPTALLLATFCIQARAMAPASAPATAPTTAPATTQPVVALLEDAAAVLPLLTNPNRMLGEGYVESKIVYSGPNSLKVIPVQKVNPSIPGWNYPIVENPSPGQFRYLRFAWLAEKSPGIMLHLADPQGWNACYVAGFNAHGWAAKSISDKPPTKWIVVTRDLYQDFGQRTITGLGLSAFIEGACYFDHIYLARTIDDLDRIDATGVRDRLPLELSDADLERLFNELSSDHAPTAYLAFWTLMAAPKQTIPLLARKLPAVSGPDVRKIRMWILDLDDADATVQQTAFTNLQQNMESSVALLRRELTRELGPEARNRIMELLKAWRATNPRPDPIERGLRILRYIDTPESRRLIEDLANGSDALRVTEAARDLLRAKMQVIPKAEK